VVFNLQTLRQVSDAWPHPSRQTFERQHQLVLARFQARAPGSLLTEMQEAPDLVTQLRQRLIVRQGEGLHEYIVSRYI
jgi:hypothetical protein